MASTIQLKTGTGSAVPSSLTQGEVGINIDNGLIFYGSGSGNTVKKLESFTNITASGDISSSGNIIGVKGQFSQIEIDGESALNTTDSATTGQVFSDSQITKIEYGKAPTTSHFFYGAAITASGDISASGLVKGLGYFIEGNVLADMAGSVIGLGYQNGTEIQIGRDLNPLRIVGNITASKNITATGSIHTLGDITASGDIKGSTLTGTVGTATQGTIDHDSLANFVANEHIDHTSVTLTAGSGLSGGGDISANRSLAVATTQTHITSITNTGLKVGRATDDTFIDFGTDDKIQLKPANSITLEVETGGIDITGNITASGNISASGNIITDKIIAHAPFSSDSLLNLHDDNVVNANGVTLSSIGSMVIMLDSNNTGTVDKLEFRADSQDASAGNLLATIEDNGDFTAEGNITASGDISASGTIYGRQIEQHDMSAGGFIISSTAKTYFPFGGQSHLENTNNLNQNIQKLAVAPGKPRKVNIKSVSNSTGLGNTGFSCSYWRVPDGDSGTSNLILVGEKRANSTGTNFEVVTFDFTSGVDSGSYDDVQDGDLVFMTILGDDTLSNMNVLAATAIWEWDYNNI